MPKALGNSKPRTSSHLNRSNSKHKFNSNKDMQPLATNIKSIKIKGLQSCNQDI